MGGWVGGWWGRTVAVEEEGGSGRVGWGSVGHRSRTAARREGRRGAMGDCECRSAFYFYSLGGNVQYLFPSKPYNLRYIHVSRTSSYYIL